MKTKIALILLPCILFLASPLFAQENKLIQFHMAILRKGPKWTNQRSVEIKKRHEQHFKHVQLLFDSGKAVAAGQFSDGDDPAGVFILRASSAEEARALMESDPEIKSGQLAVEMHPWWSEDVFGKAVMPMKFETVYFGFLKRGPNRKEGDAKTPEVQELQKAHLANINRLAETKKLVVAGPFGDDGDYRGVFVFRVGTLKEAQDLAASDPMIKIDRLRLEIHPWSVPVGIIP